MPGSVGRDQATPQLALVLVPEGRRVTLLGDLVRLAHARNPGRLLGAGAGLGEQARSAIFVWGVGLLTLAAAGVALSRRLPVRQALGAAIGATTGAPRLLIVIADLVGRSSED